MELTVRECKSAKCDADVADVLIVATKGQHKVLAIDPKPTTWQGGGRVRLSPIQPGVARHPLAKRITNPMHAFGAGKLYRPHSETCAGGTGRTAARQKGAHA